MINIELTEKAAALGFKTNAENDDNKTLAEIVQSREQRFWEAFPLLLANAGERGKLNYAAASAALPEAERKYLKLLIIVSLALYDSLGVKFGWRERLFGSFPARLIANFKEKLEQGAELELGDLPVQPERLKETFLAGFKGKALLRSAALAEEQDSLEAALAEIFTPRQRELLMKKIRREPFTKTEKEYFSRVVKKKARALANDELHRLARRALA